MLIFLYVLIFLSLRKSVQNFLLIWVFFPPINLFIYLWLCWVFVAVRGLSLVGERGLLTLHCSVRASHCGVFSCCGARALGARASVVVARGL